MTTLANKFGGTLIAVLITFAGMLSSTSAFCVEQCEQAKILSGSNNGVKCNTYHQCFRDIREHSKIVWIIKSFECPPGGIWDREYLACVEGTSCEDAGGGGGGGMTSRPGEPTPTPTAGPPLLTTTEGDGDGGTCPKPSELTCANNPVLLANTSGAAGDSWSDLPVPDFHGQVATKPDEEEADGSITIRGPDRSIHGDYTPWAECPKGWYAVSSNKYLIKQHKKAKRLLHLSFQCQSPGGNGNGTYINVTTPLYKGPSSSDIPGIGKCNHGAIIGFRLAGHKKSSADDFEGHCSANISEAQTGRRWPPPWHKPPWHKPPPPPPPRPPPKPKDSSEDSKKRQRPGEWGPSQFCRKHQAMCAVRGQVIGTNALHWWERGITHLQIRCCHVPDPLQDCDPHEERIRIGTCDNSESSQEARCEFQTEIGTSLEYPSKEEELGGLFYSSIGYDFHSIKEGLTKKIISKLAPQSSSLEYPWNAVDPQVEAPETTGSPQLLCIGPRDKVDLYQVVGRCGHFLMRTNVFLKVNKEYIPYCGVDKPPSQ